MDARPSSRPTGPPTVEVTPGETEPIHVAVVRAVATATDTAPTDLPAIYESVDPDALDAVVRSLDDGGDVVLSYADCAVVVDAAGTVAVYAGA